MSDRRHDAALDGLRGLAALSVVLFHIGHWLDVPAIASNSGLAVDLFFCLSGYVLALAYGEKLGKSLSASDFLVLRAIRLLPMMLAALLISIVYLLARLVVKHESIPLEALGLATLLGVFNLPDFWAPAAIGGPQVFPLNGPQYTLFLEMVVNAIWILIPKLRRPVIGGAAAGLCFLVLVKAGVLGGDRPETFWVGFPRVGASFFIGVFVFHLNGGRHASRPWGQVFGLAVLAMAGLFYIPRSLPFWAELSWVAVLSPLLVLSGARTPTGPRLGRLMRLGGDLSYPIYTLHYPIFCWVNGAFQVATGRQDIRIEAPLVLVAVLAGSYAALKLYDAPVRICLGRSIRGRYRQNEPTATIAHGLEPNPR